MDWPQRIYRLEKWSYLSSYNVKVLLELWSLKCQNFYALYFLTVAAKIWSQFGQKKCIWKIFSSSFKNMVWLIGFGVTIREISRVEISKTKKVPKVCIFQGWHLPNGNSIPNNPNHFLRGEKKTFNMLLNIFPKLTDLLLLSSENTKRSQFWLS